MKLILFAALLLVPATVVHAADPMALEPKTSLRLTQEGLLIEASSAGQFTLDYPVQVGEKWDDVRKPIEKTVSGNTAMLQFDGPTRIAVAWQPAEGTLTFTPVSLPADVKSLCAEMLINFSYVNGGSWQIGEQKETPFPARQPAQPHLFQGNADPPLIGYYLANEPLWEEISDAVAALDGSNPRKRRLAAMLEEKHKTIKALNRARETSLGSFADLAARGLPVKSRSAKEDMQTFTAIFLQAYFRLVTEAFHKYDPNHLPIGNRFQPGTINHQDACWLSGQYMDVVSFNSFI